MVALNGIQKLLKKQATALIAAAFFIPTVADATSCMNVDISRAYKEADVVFLAKVETPEEISYQDKISKADDHGVFYARALVKPVIKPWKGNFVLPEETLYLEGYQSLEADRNSRSPKFGLDSLYLIFAYRQKSDGKLYFPDCGKFIKVPFEYDYLEQINKLAGVHL